jgi:NitT/TauT family transport system ATP-binding protein
VRVTELGRRYLSSSDMVGRKSIFRERCERLPTLQLIVELLRRSPEHRLPGDIVREHLAITFPNEPPSELFETITNWGRYGELFAYDAAADELAYVETSAPPA